MESSQEQGNIANSWTLLNLNDHSVASGQLSVSDIVPIYESHHSFPLFNDVHVEGVVH